MMIKRVETHLMIKIFGYRIYISKHRMCNKGTGKSFRKSRRRRLWEKLEHRCMECGQEVELCGASFHSRLDASHPKEVRYAEGNTLLLCPRCNAVYQRLVRGKIWQTSAMKENIDNRLKLLELEAQSIQ